MAVTTSCAAVLAVGCGASSPKTSGADAAPSPSAASTRTSLGPLPVGSAPELRRLALSAREIAPGLVGRVIPSGTVVSGQVSLDLCSQRYASESLRTARLQIAWASRHPPYSVSNELIGYRRGGSAEAMRELRKVASHCPSGPHAPVVVGQVATSFKLTRLRITGLIPGYVAVHIRESGVVGGKLRTQSLLAIYQARGEVLSAIYARPDVAAARHAAVRAARLSAGKLNAA